ILDETLKVTDGSRVRIRLLDDIMINDALLTKGTYLYGNVSGFKAQRVHINISSIMVDGRQMKVDLSVYDNDGQEGFFVPSSAFRDLSKD
ncbi:UNVERIFIED_CONTAM: conjugative transposon protein TraM, partial [Bacteroidetes bacterium 56_B9]